MNFLHITSLIQRSFSFAIDRVTTVDASIKRPIYWDRGEVALLDQTHVPLNVAWLKIMGRRGVAKKPGDVR